MDLATETTVDAAMTTRRKRRKRMLVLDVVAAMLQQVDVVPMLPHVARLVHCVTLLLVLVS